MNREINRSLSLLRLLPLAAEGAVVHPAPLPKVVFVLSYLVLIVSFGRYDWPGAMLFAPFPFLAAAVEGVRLRPLLLRTLAALPFVCCAGLANCFFDRAGLEILPRLSLPGGVVSLVVLTAKTVGSVGMVLLLTSTTAATELAGALTALRVPCLLVLQLQLMLRYLPLLIEEAGNSATAYFLRNPGRRTIQVRDWGKFAGRLFTRAFERSEAIYRSMQCRLFDARAPLAAARRAGAAQWAGAAVLIAIFGILRYML
ncbi:MAG: energy-coupling factor transporter transmembrane component T [Victivallaceae bacterium]|nr:energy-coupling factor transporter transmembrane component T [Victivallaceae bacterium]